ncbi:hypothetical protein AMTR_s00053p00223320 [Amborella trichopoda]|uniref:Uncharacterized protein n=1 Tax=Amborella trichopoda TaxID=13333 RepID=W1PDR7_AMBTC|nr:hypothetical protein AMTR_s00053p00223320 [Amborella trichopoda]
MERAEDVNSTRKTIPFLLPLEIWEGTSVIVILDIIGKVILSHRLLIHLSRSRTLYTPDIIDNALESSITYFTTGSTKGEKVKDSDDTSATVKPVRGRPVSWLSFILSFLTGAGLIFYYDKENPYLHLTSS